MFGGDAELGGVVDEVEGVVFGEAVDGGLMAGGELVGEALGVFEAEGGGLADGFDEGDFVAEVLVGDEDDGDGVLGGDGGRGGALLEADSEWHGWAPVWGYSVQDCGDAIPLEAGLRLHQGLATSP